MLTFKSFDLSFPICNKRYYYHLLLYNENDNNNIFSKTLDILLSFLYFKKFTN